MTIVFLDMEGVLVPEIWIAFAERTCIPDCRCAPLAHISCRLPTRMVRRQI